MLNDISINSTSRLREVRSFLAMIRTISSSNSFLVSSEISVAKGLFFVHLYGSYEYTVVAAVQKALSIVDSMKYNVSDFKPTMLSIVLDSRCKSIASVGTQKLWEKRWELFNQIQPNNIVNIDNTVLPTDGSNLKYPQLESIWTTLCINAPVLPRPILRGRLEELVENRNAIAHGRESASIIGGRYAIGDLEQRYNDINELCTYILQCLEGYIVNKEFLK
jgi:hypothetical protein